jgi:protocatechuate 3,4-dioxygenase beta subunit
MRSLVRTASALVALALLGRCAADEPDRFTPPPGEESEAVKALIDRAGDALRSGASTSDVLTDPQYLPAHEWPRFRALIRRHATSSRAALAGREEPGVRLEVKGRLVDRSGRPVPGSVVYAYQTSAKGWYSDRAAHVAANEGDRKHARLFAYLRTDDAGRFELRTVRPGGYPGSDLPCHIHVEVDRTDRLPAGLITEVLFDDDPRLTAEWRARSRQEGFVIAPVKKERDGSQRVEVELKPR